MLRSASGVASLLGLALGVVVPFGTAFAQIDILAERYDDSRSGANLSETVLNTSNVNASTFGKLWSYTVSGFTRAEGRSSRVWRCWDPPRRPVLLPAGLSSLRARPSMAITSNSVATSSACLTGCSAAISRKSGGSYCRLRSHLLSGPRGDYVGSAQ